MRNCIVVAANVQSAGSVFIVLTIMYSLVHLWATLLGTYFNCLYNIMNDLVLSPFDIHTFIYNFGNRYFTTFCLFIFDTIYLIENESPVC